MTIQRTLLSFLVAATLTAAQPKSPEAALGAARHLEEAEGNYPAAIEAYKKIVAQSGSSRVTGRPTANGLRRTCHLGLNLNGPNRLA